MENFCNDLWPLIYDQVNHGRHEDELAFYTGELVKETGPVLEAACGTGMILLPLLARGVDAYGFDLSGQMLAELFSKARKQDVRGIETRVSRQNMVSFHYDRHFSAIIIPARSFLHLTAQDEQIDCLKNIYTHLSDGGRLLLNFFTPQPDVLLKYADTAPEYLRFNTFRHPSTGENIDVSFKQFNDLAEQVQYITWQFRIGERSYETPMKVRWVYRWEFALLAKVAGFRKVDVYGGFDKSPYTGVGEMVWVLEK